MLKKRAEYNHRLRMKKFLHGSITKGNLENSPSKREKLMTIRSKSQLVPSQDGRRPEGSVS